MSLFLSNSTPQAIIWDMDGVLVDNNDFHFQAWADIFQQYTADHHPLSRARFDAVYGMGNPDTVRYLFGERQATPEFIATVSRLKEEIFRQRIKGNLTLLPGVWDWLNYWRRAGLKQALGSSAPALNVEAILNEVNARPFFDAVVCLESAGIKGGKPAPDIFLEAARQLKVDPAHCVVIEDAVVGVQAAKTAGMRCVAITATHPAQALSAADRVVAGLADFSPEQLLQAWPALLKSAQL